MTDTTTQPTTPETTAPQPVQLQVNDITNGTILLKVAIDRGTFKTEELNEVMAVYNRLFAFVSYVQAEAQKESQAAANAEAPAAQVTETKKHKKSKK